ncbi:Far upstream element-binding protein [Musa troglodytarum]|uniref:Far upstream element-binding protein n=1 Tax=Musa troglodytarum TaxID=320322 RepID=A0A9E7GJ03_9LILI|nr:Far upstream element-binding protein [Musa troglodytarum]
MLMLLIVGFFLPGSVLVRLLRVFCTNLMLNPIKPTLCVYHKHLARIMTSEQVGKLGGLRQMLSKYTREQASSSTIIYLCRRKLGLPRVPCCFHQRLRCIRVALGGPNNRHHLLVAKRIPHLQHTKPSIKQRPRRKENSDQAAHPVGREDYEQISARHTAMRHLRDRDDAMVLKLEVPESTGHGEPGKVLVGQPHALDVRLSLEREHPPVALPNPLCFLCIVEATADQYNVHWDHPTFTNTNSSYEVRWASGLSSAESPRGDPPLTRFP